MKLKAIGILIAVPILVFIFAIVMTDKNFQNKPANSDLAPGAKIQYKENVTPPDIRLDVTKDYFVRVKTSVGDFVIKLTPLDTPMAAANFVYLSKLGFYNDLIFHRVINGFMVQSGDPRGNGTGGPGYSFNDEPFEAEYRRGAVAMANSGVNTNGSQFFIVHKDSLQLQKSYTIFGRVVEGMETIDKIAEAPTQDNGFGEMSKPVDPVKIISVEVTEE